MHREEHLIGKGRTTSHPCAVSGRCYEANMAGTANTADWRRLPNAKRQRKSPLSAPLRMSLTMGFRFSLARTGYGKTTVDWENMFTSVSALFLVLMLSGLVAGKLYSHNSIGVAFWKKGAFNASAQHHPQHAKRPKGEAGGYKVQFPPSRRRAIAAGSIEGTHEVRDLLKGPSPTQIQLETCQLPTTRAADIGKDGQYTPTGFSTEDIKALGTFPDYSALSGVPHPKPCSGFDINTATFRPFRPFRFAYHQTMCQ